jgi:hypothetical protein
VKKFVIFRFDYSPPSSRHLDPFSLHGLAPFLSKLVLEPLLVGGCRLTNLPELPLKVGNTLFLLLGMPQLVGPALGPLC